jgi:uncharacterized protein (DUF1778 family)
MLQEHERKTASLRIAITEAEKEIIAAAAKEEGRTISGIIRIAINQYLKSKGEEQ